MWSRVALIIFLCLPIAFAQDTNQTNATSPLNITELETHYLVIRIKAWVTNVTYWCKGEGVTKYDLFGGVAECRHVPERRECRCQVNLPDDQIPEYFLAYEKIEERYNDAVKIKEKEIEGLWFWINLALSITAASIVSLVFISKLLPRFRVRFK
ncbi:MAG: hypothetical protein ACTSUF_09685 [Candidatus Heimdallarchaeaceae archaeon]